MGVVDGGNMVEKDDEADQLGRGVGLTGGRADVSSNHARMNTDAGK